MILRACYNPLQAQPGFCLPLLRGTDLQEYFIQEVRDEKICEFTSVTVNPDRLQMLHGIHNLDINDNAVHVFFTGKEYMTGTRETLVVELSKVADEFKPFPYLYRDVANFISDRGRVDEAMKQIEELHLRLKRRILVAPDTTNAGNVFEEFQSDPDLYKVRRLNIEELLIGYD